MRIDGSELELTSLDADAVVIGCWADEPLTGYSAVADAALGGAVTRLLESEEISSKLADTAALLAPSGLPARQLLVVGLGSRDHWSRGAADRAAGAAAMALADRKRERIAFCFDDWDTETTAAGICGAIVAMSGQALYRAKPKLHACEEICWPKADEAAIEQGKILGESVNLTRELVNEPANGIYPASFADRAEQLAEEFGLEVEIWGPARLEQERCGSMLGVAQGSSREPRLVILRHRGGEGDPLALVGKGVTFDSGGLSLKPSDSMKTMKCDMAGAATVLGAMCAIARSKLPTPVVGLMGLVENMVSGSSYKLGDVLTARSGKTIEVLNTDAEGRLVLADVLNVALDEKPARIIDLATLTGACVVALGVDVAGLMSNDREWEGEIASAAADCGEEVWPLPMHSFYGDQIRSKVADIKNIGEGRWGGAITAAKFLEEFIDDTPWTHIDIAGPAFLDSPKSWIDAGGRGMGVRTLVEVARNFGK